MRLATLSLMIAAAVSFSTSGAFAGQVKSTGFHPGGGWDANNVRVATSHVKLIATPNGPANEIPRGGWDGNNVRVGVSHVQLLSSH